MSEERDQPTPSQTATVASFTLFALRSRSITATVERGVRLATDLTSAPMGALVQVLGPGRVAVVHGEGPVSLTPGESYEVDADLLTTTVCSGPWPGGGVCLRLGPSGSRSLPAAGAGATLSVSVPVEGTPWGRLLVARSESRVFTEVDSDLVQAVAAVLSAALERERRESGLAAVAAFGRFALESPDVGTTVKRAVDLVTRALEAPIGAVVRVARQHGRLVIVQASAPVGLNPGAEYRIDPRLADVLLTPDPLMAEDWRADHRFATPLLPHAARAVAHLATAIPLDRHPGSRLVVGDTRPRQFSDTEVEIMTSTARMLAAALQPQRLHGAPSGTTSRAPDEERRLASPVTEVALVNRAGVIVWVNGAWEDFAYDNGGHPGRTGVGVSYLACCDAAEDPVADQVGDAIRTAVQGDLPAPMRVVIPCHSPQSPRWFDVLISSRFDDDGNCLGASVTLSAALP